MAMGTRSKLSGSEQDDLTKSKRWYNHKAGSRHWTKSKFWRRIRKEIRRALAQEGEKK